MQFFGRVAGLIFCYANPYEISNEQEIDNESQVKSNTDDRILYSVCSSRAADTVGCLKEVWI